MTFFVGHKGAIKLERGGDRSFIGTVSPSDVNTTLNRFSFENSEENLLTGDMVEFSTNDPRGLLFIPASYWSIPNETNTGYVVQQNIRANVNVNGVGGIRLFDNFIDAINNTRANEIALAEFAGDPIEVMVTIRDNRPTTLGSVTSFELNTDRAAMETTSLSDKFKQQYSAGLLSGNGSIECLFSYETVDVQETPLFLLQVINRIDAGSNFKAIFAISSDENIPGFVTQVYYEVEAVITRAGVTVTSDALVTCSIDFVTTGEFKLKVGVPEEYILKEDGDAMYLEQSLDYLLQEVTD